jgi:hypothetical protein
MQVISIINDPSSDAASLWPHSLARGLRNAARIISRMGLGAWDFSGFFTPKIAGFPDGSFLDLPQKCVMLISVDPF